MFSFAKQVTGFYIKRNIKLKWVDLRKKEIAKFKIKMWKEKQNVLKL